MYAVSTKSQACIEPAFEGFQDEVLIPSVICGTGTCLLQGTQRQTKRATSTCLPFHIQTVLRTLRHFPYFWPIAREDHTKTAVVPGVHMQVTMHATKIRQMGEETKANAVVICPLVHTSNYS